MDILEAGFGIADARLVCRAVSAFFNAGTFERSVIWEKSSGQTLQETFKTYSDPKHISLAK